MNGSNKNVNKGNVDKCNEKVVDNIEYIYNNCFKNDEKICYICSTKCPRLENGQNTNNFETFQTQSRIFPSNNSSVAKKDIKGLNTTQIETGIVILHLSLPIHKKKRKKENFSTKKHGSEKNQNEEIPVTENYENPIQTENEFLNLSLPINMDQQKKESVRKRQTPTFKKNQEKEIQNNNKSGNIPTSQIKNETGKNNDRIDKKDGKSEKIINNATSEVQDSIEKSNVKFGGNLGSKTNKQENFKSVSKEERNIPKSDEHTQQHKNNNATNNVKDSIAKGNLIFSGESLDSKTSEQGNSKKKLKQEENIPTSNVNAEQVKKNVGTPNQNSPKKNMMDSKSSDLEISKNRKQIEGHIQTGTASDLPKNENQHDKLEISKKVLQDGRNIATKENKSKNDNIDDYDKLSDNDDSDRTNDDSDDDSDRPNKKNSDEVKENIDSIDAEQEYEKYEKRESSNDVQQEGTTTRSSQNAAEKEKELGSRKRESSKNAIQDEKYVATGAVPTGADNLIKKPTCGEKVKEYYSRSSEKVKEYYSRSMTYLRKVKSKIFNKRGSKSTSDINHEPNNLQKQEGKMMEIEMPNISNDAHRQDNKTPRHSTHVPKNLQKQDSKTMETEMSKISNDAQWRENKTSRHSTNIPTNKTSRHSTNIPKNENKTSRHSTNIPKNDKMIADNGKFSNSTLNNPNAGTVERNKSNNYLKIINEGTDERNKSKHSLYNKSNNYLKITNEGTDERNKSKHSLYNKSNNYLKITNEGTDELNKSKHSLNNPNEGTDERNKSNNYLKITNEGTADERNKSKHSLYNKSNSYLKITNEGNDERNKSKHSLNSTIEGSEDKENTDNIAEPIGSEERKQQRILLRKAEKREALRALIKERRFPKKAILNTGSNLSRNINQSGEDQTIQAEITKKCPCLKNSQICECSKCCHKTIEDETEKKNGSMNSKTDTETSDIDESLKEETFLQNSEDEKLQQHDEEIIKDDESTIMTREEGGSSFITKQKINQNTKKHEKIQNSWETQLEVNNITKGLNKNETNESTKISGTSSKNNNLCMERNVPLIQIFVSYLQKEIDMLTSSKENTKIKLQTNGENERACNFSEDCLKKLIQNLLKKEIKKEECNEEIFTQINDLQKYRNKKYENQDISRETVNGNNSEIIPTNELFNKSSTADNARYLQEDASSTSDKNTNISSPVCEFVLKKPQHFKEKLRATKGIDHQSAGYSQSPLKREIYTDIAREQFNKENKYSIISLDNFKNIKEYNEETRHIFNEEKVFPNLYQLTCANTTLAEKLTPSKSCSGEGKNNDKIVDDTLNLPKFVCKHSKNNINHTSSQTTDLIQNKANSSDEEKYFNIAIQRKLYDNKYQSKSTNIDIISSAEIKFYKSNIDYVDLSVHTNIPKTKIFNSTQTDNNNPISYNNLLSTNNCISKYTEQGIETENNNNNKKINKEFIYMELNSHNILPGSQRNNKCGETDLNSETNSILHKIKSNNASIKSNEPSNNITEHHSISEHLPINFINKNVAYIVETDMKDSSMIQYAVTIVTKAFEQIESGSISCIASYIRHSFEEKFGKVWHCTIGKKFDISFSHHRNTYINLRFDGTRIVLYKLKLK